MEAEIYGMVNKPVIMVVGTWDPFLHNYYKLLDHVGKYAATNGFTFLPVILDPSPHNLVRNIVFPTYDNCSSRIRMLLDNCGAVAKFTMTENELGDGVEDFLKVFFKKSIEVAELWLYEGQTMGRGGKSNIIILTAACAALGIKVTTIPNELNFKKCAAIVKDQLSEGKVIQAAQTVGHFSLWETESRDAKNIPIGWKAGPYEYCIVSDSENKSINPADSTGTLHVYKNEKGDTVFDWPTVHAYAIRITGPDE